MSNIQKWFIVKQKNGQCKVVEESSLKQNESPTLEKWGPFASQEDAVAHRVGLIRAGKCQPR